MSQLLIIQNFQQQKTGVSDFYIWIYLELFALCLLKQQQVQKTKFEFFLKSNILVLIIQEQHYFLKKICCQQNLLTQDIFDGQKSFGQQFFFFSKNIVTFYQVLLLKDLKF